MIKNPASILYLNQFSGIREFFTGNSLDPLKYTTLDNIYLAGTYRKNLNQNKIEMSLSTDFYLGEAVLIKSGNFPVKNIISNIGDNKFYLLKDALQDENGDSLIDGQQLEVKKLSKISLQLNNLDEGLYIIEPTNQKLIIRKSFQQPFVSLEDLSSELIDVTSLEQYRLSQLRDTALKTIYAELSGFDNYYDIIDDVDLWLLLKLKIQCMLYRGDVSDENKNPYCDLYSNLIKTYRPIAILPEAGGIPSNIPDMGYSVGEWSL